MRVQPERHRQVEKDVVRGGRRRPIKKAVSGRKRLGDDDGPLLAPFAGIIRIRFKGYRLRLVQPPLL